MTMKIPSSLIRLPTITSKRRHSVKLFHFITSSFFFLVIRPLPSFSVATINFITLSSFSGVTIAELLPYSSRCSGVLLNFGVKSFSYQIDVAQTQANLYSLVIYFSLHRIYHSRYELKLQKSSLNFERAN